MNIVGRPESCEYMYTWWVAVGFFKIYATRNFPFLRFIINVEHFFARSVWFA